MALINRLTRLFRADMHAVLDRIEEPDLLLKQAIRDMEAAFAGDEQRSGRLQTCHNKLAGMNEELDICFQLDQEDLTKNLIRKKLELVRFTDQLELRRNSLQQTLVDLTQRLNENRTQLESLRQKAQLLAVDSSDSSESDVREPAAIHIDEADVEIAFLREKQRRSRS